MGKWERAQPTRQNRKPADGLGRTESSAPTEGWEPYATYDAFRQIRRRGTGAS